MRKLCAVFLIFLIVATSGAISVDAMATIRVDNPDHHGPSTLALSSQPDVAEIEFFNFDECTNIFHWRSTTEINIWGYRIEHPGTGWQSAMYWAANYGSNRPMEYAILGQQFADLDGYYWLTVYFDNGTSRTEDIAERVCHFEKP